jgi:hypothetical protein
MYLIQATYLVSRKPKRGGGHMPVLADQMVIIIRTKAPIQAVVISCANPALPREKSIADMRRLEIIMGEIGGM